MPVDRAGLRSRLRRAAFVLRWTKPRATLRQSRSCAVHAHRWNRVASRFGQVIHRMARPRACGPAHLPLVDGTVARGLNRSDVRSPTGPGQRPVRKAVDNGVRPVGTIRGVAVDSARTTCGQRWHSSANTPLTCEDARRRVWIARSCVRRRQPPAGLSAVSERAIPGG